MDDQFLRLTPGKVLGPLRGLLREAITGVGPDVMDRKDQRIAAEQRQRQIKPQMRTLIVDHLGNEFMDSSNQSTNAADLPNGLPQP
jgi:hypothetical protein